MYKYSKFEKSEITYLKFLGEGWFGGHGFLENFTHTFVVVNIVTVWTNHHVFGELRRETSLYFTQKIKFQQCQMPTNLHLLAG